MGETIRIPENEVIEAMEDGELVSQGSWRWGTTQTYVVRRFEKYFLFTVQIHAEEGLQTFGSITATEVRPVQKTVTAWEPVPSGSAPTDGK